MNGSYHIAALLYKKHYLGQNLTNIVKTYVYPTSIDNDFLDSINIIIRDINTKGISREMLAQYFKLTESYK